MAWYPGPFLLVRMGCQLRVTKGSLNIDDEGKNRGEGGVCIVSNEISMQNAWQPLGPLLKVKLLVGYM